MPTRKAKANSLLKPVPSGAASYAQCRSLGHEWKHRVKIDPLLKRPYSVDAGSIPLQSQCTDCKTLRTRWITRSGEVLTRYEYPDGYATHGDERRTQREWRASFVTSLFEASAFTVVKGA